MGSTVHGVVSNETGPAPAATVARTKLETYHEGNDPVADLDCAVPRREEVLQDRDNALAEFRGEALENQVGCPNISKRAMVSACAAYGMIQTRCRARHWVCRSGGRRCGARRKRWVPTHGSARRKRACRCVRAYMGQVGDC
jgi:hypothetical protein